MPISITDPGDSRIAAYRHLRDAELRRRMEADEGLFVVEGPGAVRMLLTTDWPVLSVLLRPERAATLVDVVGAAQTRGAPVYVASPACFDAIAGFHVHRGVLALGGRRPQPDPSMLLARVDIVVVLEGVNDHENLGAIFRNAAALGAGAVLLDPTCCDPLYRRSVRVSVGQVLRVPFSRMSPWPEALDGVTSSGFSIVAMDPHSPTTIDVIPSLAKVALMVGGEGPGLSEGAYSKATWRVRIPMTPGVDSLNVASALAIALNRLVHL
ncbi:MAG TPA: RNA methyltransferase [Acidimicrobiales bacterium]|nr:RNA methyltransferase [Acidimicrobiales bacterium]